MDASLLKRIEELRRLKEKFGLDQKKIARYAEPPKSHITVSYVFKAENAKYLTETNVAAIEKGVRKILDEFREELCR
jgi:predicted transcriptional regulator